MRSVLKVRFDLPASLGGCGDRPEIPLNLDNGVLPEKIRNAVLGVTAAISTTNSGSGRAAANGWTASVDVLRLQHDAIPPEGLVGLGVANGFTLSVWRWVEVRRLLAELLWHYGLAEQRRALLCATEGKSCHE